MCLETKQEAREKWVHQLASSAVSSLASPLGMEGMWPGTEVQAEDTPREGEQGGDQMWPRAERNVKLVQAGAQEAQRARI